MVVLGLFAHPDDEAYGAAGTLALCAQRGARVVIASATRGEAGVDRRGRVSNAALAVARSAELAASCAIIGAEPPRHFELPDGQLDEHVARGADALAALVAELRPEVLITHGRDGAYGHADHIAVNQMSAGAAVACVLHVAFLPHTFARVHRAWRHAVRDVALGADARDLCVDITAVQHIKRAALAAHASQLSAGDPMTFLGGVLADLMEREYFHLAAGGLPTRGWLSRGSR
jgi:LmbE family N-acetylglucosaminyl deacetylase